MPPSVALAGTCLVIAFLLYRDIKLHPTLSHHLWIPLVWFFVLGSRNVSAWLSLGATQIVDLEAYQEGNALDRNFLLLFIVLSTVVLLRRRLPWGEILRKNRIIFYFMLFCLVSILWSEFPFVAFKRFFKFSGLMIIVLVVLSERSPGEATLAILRRMSYLIICLSALFVRYFPEYGRYYHIWTYEVGYSGACVYKNQLGVACIIAAMVFLWGLLHETGGKTRLLKSITFWSYLFMLALTLYLLSIANSATATFCVVVGAAIILGTSLPSAKNRPSTVGNWVLGTMVFAAMLEIAFNIKDKIALALGREPSLTGRLPLWNILLGMENNPLLGTGYESFWTIDRLTYIWSLGYTALQAHNGYIDTYLNLGLAGVAFFLALIISHFKNVVREFSRDYSLGQLKLAFFMIFVLYNYTEAAFPRLGLLLLIFFMFMIELPRPDEGLIEEEPVNPLAVDTGF